MSIFGPIVSDDMIEDAVTFTLKKWVPTSMRVLEEQLELEVGHYLRPRSWEVHGDFDKFPEELMPAVVVVSIGTDDTPVKRGNRMYEARWNIAVADFASSTDLTKSRRMSYRLGAAIRAAMTWRQSLDGQLDGRIVGVDWTGSRNGEFPVNGERTVWGTRQTFSLTIENLMQFGGGPPAPDALPPDEELPLPEWEVVPDREHIHIDLEHQ